LIEEVPAPRKEKRKREAGRAEKSKKRRGQIARGRENLRQAIGD